MVFYGILYTRRTGAANIYIFFDKIYKSQAGPANIRFRKILRTGLPMFFVGKIYIRRTGRGWTLDSCALIWIRTCSNSTLIVLEHFHIRTTGASQHKVT